jgi:DNA-directed RNA polymerase specialized sigma24 family protein
MHAAPVADADGRDEASPDPSASASGASASGASVNGGSVNGGSVNSASSNGAAIRAASGAAPQAALEPAAAESAAMRAVTELHDSQYRPLVRLAALLTGDVGAAERLVQDSFVAMYGTWDRLRDSDRALAYLRQAVLTGSRSLPAAPAGSAAGVVDAVRALPLAQREAVMLRFYLDLPDQQLAAAMGLGQDAARRHLSAGLAALRADR